MDLVAGMIVAKCIIGGSGNRATLRIAVGSTISADTIAQLINKGIECVAVYQNDCINDAIRADETLHYNERLDEIFGPEPSESCGRLLLALRTGYPSKC